MAVWRRGFMKKRHQIAVALWVSFGRAMAAAIALTVVAEWRLWRKTAFSFLKFSQHRLGRVGLTRPNPNPIFA